MIVHNESERVAALRQFDILDTAPEPLFDALAELAARSAGTSIGLISLVDSDRQWFKARVGLDATETPRVVAFCDHAIRTDQVMVVPDATADPRFCDNPLVTGAPGIRFYAGAPLITPEGHALGTLCVIDTKTRTLDADGIAQLRGYADAVMQAVTLRSAEREHLRIATLAADKREFLGLAGQVAKIGVWAWEAQTGELTFSRELYTLFGLDPDNAVPLSIAESLGRMHPDDALELARLLDRAMQDTTPFEYHCRMRDRCGGFRRIGIHVGSRKRPDGSVRGLIATFQDVTQYYRMGEALRQSEDRYRLLVEQATDLIVRSDLGGTITWVSPSSKRLLGYVSEDLVGSVLLDHVHPDDQPAVRCAAQIDPGSTIDVPSQRVEYRARHKCGKWVWLEADPTIVRDPQSGEPIERVCVARDITARRLADAGLRAARDAAQAAARVKSDFLANMSHELRTPLTTIIGFSGLLKDSQGLPPPERRFAELIAMASGSLRAVIDDVLDYSKFEAGTITFDPKPFDPRELASSTLELVNADAHRKSLKLVLDVQGPLDRLSGDAHRLRQVLLNLLSNAVKFTPAGAINLKLDLTPTDGAMDLRFAVTDTGIGIAPDLLPKLFERFVQADSSITRQFGGTGLGLAISRQLVDAMGGQIGAHSDAGQGSTFWFRCVLPVAPFSSHAQAW